MAPVGKEYSTGFGRMQEKAVPKFWVQLFAMGGLEACFFWPIVGGIFYKKGNKQAAVASSVIGVLVYVISYQFKITIWNINAVVWGLLFSGIAYFVIETSLPLCER